MKKLLLTLLSITFITTQINANDKEKTEDELVAEFMESVERERLADKRIEEAKAKTKAIMQLSKTVDKLANTLGVNDK